MKSVSTRRRHLATFGNAYAVAVRLVESTGNIQYVVKSTDATRPFRVTPTAPRDPGALASLIA